MTNAEKYLKDVVDILELCNDYYNFYNKRILLPDTALEMFFEQEAKPTLTEDERVILSKLKSDYKYIGKKTFLRVEFLYVSCNEKCEDFTTLTPFEHLFQFIKNGEEYEIKELLKGE